MPLKRVKTFSVKLCSAKSKELIYFGAQVVIGCVVHSPSPFWRGVIVIPKDKHSQEFGQHKLFHSVSLIFFTDPR